ncbi:hypothetical protein ACN47E_004421 [Coniothyrium glycines]
MLREQSRTVDFLILGAGWTSQFLIPALTASHITYAATTTTGRDSTLPFKFDPDSTATEPYTQLPSAHTILIVFPLVGPSQSKTLVHLYRSIHGAHNHWIQLGATTIYNQLPTAWSDDASPYNTADPRAIAEDKLRALGGEVLNLSGLYGGTRDPRTWLPRIVRCKQDVRARGAVHFIHGADVARAVLATHRNPQPGKRWIVSDLRVYDWFDLIMSFSAAAAAPAAAMGGDEAARSDDAALCGQCAQWVGEIMLEDGIRALPRSVEVLGRKLDSRGFWEAHGVWPGHGRVA